MDLPRHDAAGSSSSSLPLHRRQPLPHRRPNHLAHHRSYSQPTVLANHRPFAATDMHAPPPPTPDAQHGSLLANVRRGFRSKGPKEPASDTEHDFSFPLSSVPPPTIPEIMMGLHLSRTPHLPQAHPRPAPGPPPVVRNEENSPAPPFLFALLRARAEAAVPPQHRVYRRSTIHATPSSSASPPGTARPKVPLPPPPKRSSLKKTSTNSSDSSIPTTPGATGTSGSPNGRGTPSPSISSISSSRHEHRTPSKLRFSTLFRPAHRKDVPAPAPPPPTPPKKAVRFSPSYSGLSNAATAGGYTSSPEIHMAAAATAKPQAETPPTASASSVPSSGGTRRSQFVRRVSGRAREAAKDVFAVITDPVSRR